LGIKRLKSDGNYLDTFCIFNDAIRLARYSSIFITIQLISYHFLYFTVYSRDEEGGSSFAMRSELLSGDPAGVVEPSESSLDPVDFA
jgi:hypothetical protein